MTGRIDRRVQLRFEKSIFAINDRLYLEYLFVAPGHRGRGVARAMIQAVIELGKKAAADKVFWQTEETNYAGRMLCDKMAVKSHIVYPRKLNR